MAATKRQEQRHRRVLGTVALLVVTAAVVAWRTPSAAPPALPRAGQEPSATPTATRDPFRPVRQGVLQAPVGLDVAPDGRVYLSDPGPGLVHVLRPWGEFDTPIGLDGPPEARLEQPGRLAIGQDAATGDFRLYVLDTGAKQVKVYDLDGGFLAAWPKIKGAAIAVAPDGRVFVADTSLSVVRVLDGAGNELYQFGEKGELRGQFKDFRDLGVSPDGRSLAVGDLKGKRVQLFGLPVDPTSDDVRLRRVYDLEQPRYTSGELTCRATIVSLLDREEVWVGEGNGACRLSGDQTLFPIASTALSGAVCKATVRLPRIRPGSGQFFALAVYDPNPGPCGGKSTTLPAAPLVLSYMDLDLRRVRTYWPAASGYFQRTADDTLVRSSQPNENAGREETLRLRQKTDDVIHSYLKFEVKDLDEVVGRPQPAQLHLFVQDGSDSGGRVYRTANDYPTPVGGGTPTPWSEDDLTWSTAPGFTGTPISTVGAVGDAQWAAFDLGAAVGSDGVYSFGLDNESSNSVYFNADEAPENPPLLVVGMAVAAVPTPAGQVSPTVSPPPSNTATATAGASATVTATATAGASATATTTSGATVTATEPVTPTATLDPGSGAVFAPLVRHARPERLTGQELR